MLLGVSELTVSVLNRIAKVLGPRGLMPNPKLGTLIEPGGMQSAVEAMKQGRVEYRQAAQSHCCNGAC